jgi:hypothetical protein
MPDRTFHPKRVAHIRVNATADGDNPIVPAPGAGKAIMVLSYQLDVVGAGAATIRSAGSNIHYVITGVAAPGVSRSHVADPDVGAFIVTADTALIVNNAAGVDTTGHIAYRTIDV